MQRSGTILVVDDSPDMREVLRAVLEGDGYRVDEAANGAEALRYLRQHEPPQLIVLDLMMPVMNGWEFREAQRHDAALASIPVVVFSANINNGTSAPIDVACCLPKSVDAAKLLATVESHADKPAPPRE